MYEAIRIAPGNTEHIQCAHGHLDQQDAATFDIGEKDLNHTVGECDQRQDIEQAGADFISNHKTAYQHVGAFPSQPQALLSGKNPGEIPGKSVLQADAELI